MADEPRRYLIAAGVENYSAPGWIDLPEVRQEVACIGDLLTGPDFRLRRVLKRESHRPNANFLTALSTWAKASDRQPDDHLVLYWSGHGLVESGALRLLLSSTTDVFSDALDFDKLVGVLLQPAARIGPILLLLDVCFAGHATFDIGQRLEAISRARHAQAAPNLSAIWATGPRDEASPLAFADAFVEAVAECRDPGEHRFPALELDRIARQVEVGLWKRGQSPGGSWHSGLGRRDFLRNPHHVAHWPEGIDLATAQLFRKLDPEARGVDGLGEEGWFFKGRRRVFADLCGLLNDTPKPALCRVSGDPGSGKSAILSRLYLLSRQDYRQRLPPEALDETELPRQGAINGIVQLARRTRQEVLDAIARELGAAATTPNELVAELRRRTPCPVLLADGLDEAVAPKATRDLLEELACKAVLLILGSRRPVLQGAGPADLDIDLDREPWVDHEAVQRYAAHRLAVAFPNRWSAAGLDDTAHKIARRANGNFLVARLSVLVPGGPDSPEQEFPTTVGEGLDRILATLGDNEERIRALLLPLCHAEGGGLPAGPLWVSIANGIGGGRLTEADLGTMFRLAGHLIKNDLQEEGSVYRPFHAALVEHLGRRRPARQVHAAFGTALRELLLPNKTARERASNYALPTGSACREERVSLSADQIYGWRFLVRHLRRAGRNGQADRLLTDYAWIRAKLCALGTLGPRSLIADYLLESRDEGAQLIRRALLLSLPTLVADPRELPRQIFGRLGSLEYKAAVAIVAAARIDPAFSPAPRWPGLTPPGAERLCLRGHKRGLRSAAFSPKEACIVTASYDGTARLWDALTGAEINVLPGHEITGLSAAFSPDGTRIVTASLDGTARLWNIVDGIEINVLRGHEDWVLSAAFSPDGHCIVTASRDRTARLWDAVTGAEINVLRGHENGVWSAAFSPKEARIVTASNDGTARLWDAVTGAEIKVLRGHESDVRSAAFSPNGTRIITASDDRTARIWDALTGAEITVLRGHEDWVLSAAFSPDGTRIVTASDDYTARLWNATTGTEITVLRGHESWVQSAAFSPDGHLIATASRDRTARLWDAATEITARPGHESDIMSIGFSPDGTRIVTASADHTVRLWDAFRGVEITILRRHEDGVLSAAFSPDGTRIVTASADHTVRLWGAVTGAEIIVLPGHESDVRSAAFSPDGTRIVSASYDGTVRLWDAVTGDEITVLRGHESDVRSAAFSPDGTRIVTASEDHTVRLWDAFRGAEIATLRGHENGVLSAAFSPAGHRIVTASRDRTARLWDTATGTEISRITLDAEVTALAIHGTALALGDALGRIHIFDAEDILG